MTTTQTKPREQVVARVHDLTADVDRMLADIDKMLKEASK